VSSSSWSSFAFAVVDPKKQKRRDRWTLVRSLDSGGVAYQVRRWTVPSPLQAACQPEISRKARNINRLSSCSKSVQFKFCLSAMQLEMLYADLLCDAQKQAGCLSANQQREIDAKNGGLLRL
jgi:hypothetical protein